MRPVRIALCYFFSMLMILLVASIGLVSCGSKQQLHTTSKTQTNTSDSLLIKHLIERNGKVNDSLFKAIGEVKTARPECDSITRAFLEDFLRSLATKKTSGNNEYGMYYDEYRKMLVMYTNLAETVNSLKETESKSSADTASEAVKEVPVEQLLPIWIKVLAGIGGAAIVYAVAKIKK